MSNDDRNAGTSGVVLSFLLGALSGAALAILFAPRSGRETREMLSDKMREAADRSRRLGEQALAEGARGDRGRLGLPGPAAGGPREAARSPFGGGRGRTPGLSRRKREDVALHGVLGGLLPRRHRPRLGRPGGVPPRPRVLRAAPRAARRRAAGAARPGDLARARELQPGEPCRRRDRRPRDPAGPAARPASRRHDRQGRGDDRHDPAVRGAAAQADRRDRRVPEGAPARDGGLLQVRRTAARPGARRRGHGEDDEHLFI